MAALLYPSLENQNRRWPKSGRSRSSGRLSIFHVKELVTQAVHEIGVEVVEVRRQRTDLGHRGDDLVDVGDDDQVVAIQQLVL